VDRYPGRCRGDATADITGNQKGFPMAITAKNRAQLALHATTNLPAKNTLDLVRAAAGEVRGGGASLLTSGVQNIGAQVHIEVESSNKLGLSITSGKRLIELCTFTAEAIEDGEGATALRVGGLESYRTNQPTYLFIPVGPKSIAGYDPYKRFLNHIANALAAADPRARVSVQTPN
jgi:hypothetical protein